MVSDFAVSLIAGGCAGTSTDIAFFPIDTLKTRLQAPGGFFANGGFNGLYRGIAPAILASAPSAALFFVTYDTSKAQLGQTIGNPHVVHMLSATFGEIAACLFRVPAEVLKQRTQSLQFESAMAAFKHILSNKSGEGVLNGLYRGWSTTIMRDIPFTMIQFPLYEQLKKWWAIYDQTESLSLAKGAICGSIAGSFAAALTTPLDVLKTRLMLNKERIGIFQLTRSLIQNEGYGVFLSGIGPRTMWIGAGGAIFLGVYEFVSSVIKSDDNEKLS